MLAPVMPHALALAVEVATTALTVAGMSYFAAGLIAARIFVHERGKPLPEFAPSVSILKSLKGVDPGMMDGFRSHCRQNYAGEFELLFGVSSLDDPAVQVVLQLQREFPQQLIQLIECPARLGSNGKVSALAQMATHARNEFLLVNDSDITVSERYLERVMACFARSNPSRTVGLVTTLYRGRAQDTLPSRMEALGIATDFQAGVLLSKYIEGGLKFGLGSTLAVRREALERIGGFASLVDDLADDYELGARIAAAGFAVELAPEVVETAVPAYENRGFFEHQLRWLRTVRDSRPWGYVGLIFTHGLAWALLNVVASGLSLVSVWLLAMSFFLRLTLAMTVGAEVLGDRQVLPLLWLLPARDAIAMGLWVAGFAGDTIVWRGERFRVKGGKLQRAG